jgi:hypothetical protein
VAIVCLLIEKVGEENLISRILFQYSLDLCFQTDAFFRTSIRKQIRSNSARTPNMETRYNALLSCAEAVCKVIENCMYIDLDHCREEYRM